MTEVGRLFQMAGTAEIKVRPPYAVLVRGAWSRGRVDERNVIVIDEPECWLEIS